MMRSFNIEYFIMKMNIKLCKHCFVFPPTDASSTGRSKNGYVFQEMGA